VTPSSPGAAPAPRAATASLLVAFAACCFGSISILTVVATRAGTSLATLLFWRYALAGLVLLPIAWRARPRVATMPGRARLARQVLVAGLGQAAVAFLSLSALGWITAATLGFLFYTFPAWVTLFAALRGTERIDARRLLALALSLGGIVLTVGAPSAGGGAAVWPGVLLALGAALIYALYIPYLGGLQRETTPEIATLCVCIGAATLLGLGALAQGSLTAALPARSWTVALVLALLCTVVAFQAFLRGLHGLGPVRTAIVSTVEPFWTAVLGAVVLSQPLTPGMLAGGALIAGAVLLLQLPTRGADGRRTVGNAA
jgi:drug/metabolite transporter (DMT)-like permease